MTIHRQFLTIALLIGSALPNLNGGELTATMGKQTVVMADGQNGLRYFPDQPISVISKQPLRFFVVAGNRTMLMEGTSFEKSKPVKPVLQPSGSANAYDAKYAGINSILIDKKRKEILAFFHAEKPTGGKNKEGTNRFYASIGLAVSTDEGRSFKKIGPIIKGQPEDPNWKGTAQGAAEPSVCLDHTGQWLYCYYTEHSRRDPASGKDRSVITCMARSKVSDGGRPGTWKKYYDGSFDEMGLGGKDTEVANCWAANVTYIPEMKKYVMMGSRGCVGFHSSDDGIKWENPKSLFEMDDVPIIGREIAIHPYLYIESATATEANGFLFYAYSPKYGHQKPGSPHYLVKRSIRFQLSN